MEDNTPNPTVHPEPKTEPTLNLEAICRRETLSTHEVVGFYGISRSTLYKLMYQKRIPYTKPGGKLAYFKKADIEAYLNGENTETPQAQAERARYEALQQMKKEGRIS
ncbi:MAG: helix-turn-helix domain-containing protein [Bacteroides sp.]|nr:helix-turn-helix domain-containing protein [Bacteroides sp.]